MALRDDSYQSSSSRLMRALFLRDWGQVLDPVAVALPGPHLQPQKAVGADHIDVHTLVENPHARHGKREAVIWDSLSSSTQCRLAYVMRQGAWQGRWRPPQP